MVLLQNKLEHMTSTHQSTLTTRKKSERERNQREQAEKALRNFKQELAELEAKLYKVNQSQVSAKTPPAIALAPPYDQQVLAVDGYG